MRLAAVALTLALIAVCGALAAATHDSRATYDGLGIALALSFGVVGYAVARHQPGNPIGWIFLALAASVVFDYAVRLYLVLDYRRHGGDLPHGAAAVIWRVSWSIAPLIVGLATILLFPDGRLSGRWRWVARAYADLIAASSMIDHLPNPSASPSPGASAPTDSPQATATGGQSALHQQLDLVARCVEAGVATRVFSVSLGGFDTHSNERYAQEKLLQKVDEAVTPFLRDMAADEYGKNVVVMMYSEFGRRVAANASASCIRVAG